MRRLARRRGVKGFDNARGVRSACQAAYCSALTRAPVGEQHNQVLLLEDIMGPPPSRAEIPELDQAMRELEALHGLEEVKASIGAMLQLVAANYRREQRGQPVQHVAMNRILVGNPGTGKTTVAGIYARVLKHLGLLSNGAVEMCTASDLVGACVGASQTKTSRLLERCKGRVLVIDEAYSLNQSIFGKQALDTIVEKVMGTPGEGIAVLMLGYEREMTDMMREANPGLARRMNASEPLHFKDYDNAALLEIIIGVCDRDGLSITHGALDAMLSRLEAQRAMPNFGNAGAVKNIISTAKLRMTRRVSELPDAARDAAEAAAELTREDVLGEERDPRVQVSAEELLAPLGELFGIDRIRQQLVAMSNALKFARESEKAALCTKYTRWVFKGNAGTGKTTVARAMGSMLQNAGVIHRDNVHEVTADQLCGSVVGAAQENVIQAMKTARGGVLFVDEAYSLGRGMYGEQVMTQLLSCATHDDYKHTAIVLAGYEADMNNMLSRNQGMTSRFRQHLTFMDWTPEQCARIVVQQLHAREYTLGDGATGALLQDFQTLVTRPGWANARHVLDILEDLPAATRERAYQDGADMHGFVTYGDVQGVIRQVLQQLPEAGGARPHTRPPMLDATRNTGASADVDPPLYATDAHAAPAPPAPAQVEATRELLCSKAERHDEDEAGADEDDAAAMAATAAQRKADADAAADTSLAEHTRHMRQAEEAARKAAELQARLEQLRAQQKAEEAARVQALLDALRAEEEAARAAAAALAAEEAAQEKLREMGRCPASFRWCHLGGGRYQCEGGTHFATLEDMGL